MESNPKCSGQIDTRKRNNSVSSPLHGRKQETLQNFWQKRLQPWLDLANLLPFEPTGHGSFKRLAKLETKEKECLSAAFIDRFHSPEEWLADKPLPPLEHLAGMLASGRDLLEEARRASEPEGSTLQRLESGFGFLQKELVGIFAKIRWLLEQLVAGTAREDGAPDDPWAGATMSTLAMEFEVGDYAHTGRLDFLLDSRDRSLKQALEGVEIARLRRCPACGKFFYAVRANKGACDEHLDRVRVRRGRDPELRRRYEETRRINKLTKTGMSNAKARVEVQKRSRKGRAIQ